MTEINLSNETLGKLLGSVIGLIFALPSFYGGIKILTLLQQSTEYSGVDEITFLNTSLIMFIFGILLYILIQPVASDFMETWLDRHRDIAGEVT